MLHSDSSKEHPWRRGLRPGDFQSVEKQRFERTSMAPWVNTSRFAAKRWDTHGFERTSITIWINKEISFPWTGPHIFLKDNKFSCIVFFNHDILSDKFNRLSFVICCLNSIFYRMKRLKSFAVHKERLSVFLHETLLLIYCLISILTKLF